MITLEVSVAGGKKESVKLGKFKASMVPNLIRGIDRATERLERQVKQQLGKGGTFRQTKGQPWLPNPGQELRIGHGTLRSSWKQKKAKRVSGGVEGHVLSSGPGSVYSAIHEFGGQAGRGHSVHIPARPYVAPAVEKERDAMVKDIMREVLKPLR
jgi:phage gpG-like protein